MNRQNLIWIVVTLFASLISYRTISRNPYARQIGEAFEKIERNYVKELDGKQLSSLSNAAIQTLVRELKDPNSSFIPGDDSKDFENNLNGEFGGIGIETWQDPDGKRMVVQFPIPGSPAAAAGIKSGDEIVEIDHVPLEKLGYSAAFERIRGEEGTTVDLTVKRPGRDEPLEFPKIERKMIVVPSVLGYRRGETGTWSYTIDGAAEIVYLRIGQFGMHTTDEIREILDQLKGAQYRGLILDLRDNPGGFLRDAVEITNLFIDEGLIVSTEGRVPEANKSSYALPDKKIVDVPVVVLINGHKRSASEIVAAAMQDHQRAIVVGERSYGKGTVQHPIALLPRGDEKGRPPILKLTVAHYMRPNGQNINRLPESTESDDWGVVPNPGYVVPMDDKAEERRETWQHQRERSRQSLPIKKAGDAPVESTEPESIFDENSPDPQLKRAIEAVREKAKVVVPRAA